MATTVTPKALVHGTLLDDTAPGSPGLYEAPGGITAAVVHSMTICNTDSSDHEVTVYIVTSGDSEDIASQIYKTTIAAGGTFEPPTLRVLEPGDYISAIADAADVVSFRADGFET